MVRIRLYWESCIHPPGNDDKALLAHLTESIDYALTTYPGAGVILTGDFNQFRHIQLCNSFNLKQVVKSATIEEGTFWTKSSLTFLNIIIPQ